MLIRLVVMLFLYKQRLNPARNHYEFAYEYGRVARAIASGKGFSNVLFGDTGPTAMLPPVYPYILAAIFKVFGIYTKASALAALSLNCLFSAITVLPVYFIAKKTFGEGCATWAAWGWALLPYAVYFSADWLWPTCLVTLLLALLVWLVLTLGSGGLWAWAGFGALYGLSALVEPMILSVLPVIAGWACYQACRQRRAWFTPALFSAAAFLLVVSPWFARNYRTFHQFIPFRDGFGLELRVGNTGYTEHWANTHIRLANSPDEFAEYQRVGEVAYMAHKKQQALAFIRGHKGVFAEMTFRRIVYLWTGYWSFKADYLAGEPLDPPNVFLSTTLTLLAFLGLWRVSQANPQVALLYAGLLLFYPLIYYIVHPEVYYRRPIDPYIVILCVYAIISRQPRARVLSKNSEEAYPIEARQSITASAE